MKVILVHNDQGQLVVKATGERWPLKSSAEQPMKEAAGPSPDPAATHTPRPRRER